MVVVRVGDYYDVYDWDFGELAGDLSVSFRAHEGEGTAAVFEDGVEEHAQAGGEFHVVAGMAEPCCTEGCGRVAGGEEGRLNDWYCWWGGIWPFHFPREHAPRCAS